MRKFIISLVVGMMAVAMVGGVASAAGHAPAYGKTIINVTNGCSFGQLVGPAKSGGTSTHENYKGGAKALVEAVVGPGHPEPDCSE